MLMPLMSSEVQVLSGGFIIAVGLEASDMYPTADGGRFSLGEESGETTTTPLGSIGVALTRFGLVIRIADLVMVRDAMALARAL